MTIDFEKLQAQIMKLSKADRLRLLERLVASLDLDIEQYWDTVAEARDAEIDAGSIEGVPLEEAMARLRAKFPG